MATIVNKLIRKLMLLFIIFLVTAASYQGYFAKWAFLDTGYGNSFADIVDGTAYRPFVYRRLLPEVSLAIESSLSADQKDWLTNKFQGSNILAATYKQAAAANSNYIVRYYLIYYLAFICFFVSIIILRELCLPVTQDRVAATLAPLVFALVFPLLETVGGYFYDLSELVFLSSAAIFAWRGWWAALLVLAPFAEFNKESFLFFLITLYPLFRRTKSVRFTVGVLFSAALAAGLVYIQVKSYYTGNPGGAVEWHLYEQLSFLLQPSSYFQTEYNYSLLTGRGFFIFHVIFITIIIKSAWSKLHSAWQKHAKLALAVNFPLFIMFCAPGELRNLSLTYIAGTLMLAVFLSEVIKSSKTNSKEKEDCQGHYFLVGRRIK